MNPYPFFGAAILVTSALGYGFWERGNAESWQNKYLTLQTSYDDAARKAKDDADAQAAKDMAELRKSAGVAISQSQLQTQQAKKQLQAYQVKLAEASKAKDLPHLCAGVLLPEDLRP